MSRLQVLFDRTNPPKVRTSHEGYCFGKPLRQLTNIALEAFRRQIELSGPGQWLFPSDGNKTGHQTEFKKIWERRFNELVFLIFGSTTFALRMPPG